LEGPPDWGLDARLTTFLLKKKYIVPKSKEMKTKSNLAGYSKEVCGSKRAVLPMLLLLMMMTTNS
jgi:hypothetical protein